MGKKKQKNADVNSEQIDALVESTEQMVEETVQEPEAQEQENLSEPVAQEGESLQEQTEEKSQKPEVQEEEVASEQGEAVVDDAPEPEVQIKEWRESEQTSEAADVLTAADEKTEKKTKVLQWAGVAMLVIVGVVGIVIGIAGKDRESVPANSGAVTTPTLAADVLDEKVPTGAAESEPTKQAEYKLDEKVTQTPTPEPTKESEKELVATPTLTPTPSPTEAPTSTPTPTPEPTKAPTATPVITQAPVTVGDIDVSKYSAYSSKAEGWGIGKNTEHKQPTAWGYDDKYKFDEVGAWYVDKNATEDDKVIYLTFNCGYEVGYTEGFLEVLKKHDVKASWFVLEEYIRQCPEEIRWLMENGHLVGSHSAYHLNYGTSSPEAVIKDMLKNEQRMRDYVGLEMDKIMRPPSGYYNEQTLRIMQDLGYKTYFWSLAYPDWDPNDQPSEEYILNYFKANHHNGAIAVIHITSGKGMKVLDEVITMLKAEGYRFGLVTEIE